MASPLIKYGWLRALLFLLVWIAMQMGINKLAEMALAKLAGKSYIAIFTTYPLLVLAICSMVGSWLAVLLFRKLVDRKSLYSLGFTWQGFQNHAFTGFFVAIFILTAASLSLLVTGHLSFNGFDFYWPGLLVGFVVMALVAVAEELVVRGYLLGNLMESLPKRVALAISAAVFALLHLFNPSANAFSFLCIFIAGILLGINYMYTRNLWYGILLHFAWNFTQGPILGYSVSGLQTESLLIQSVKGASWLTGGSFGLEGSVITIVLNIAMIGGLAVYYNRRVQGLQIAE